jgi:NitT/TauT family transport system substrate-binding protein
MENVSIQFTRFSAFYSPLIATVSGGFLAEEGLAGDLSVAEHGVSALQALLCGEAELVQSAPSQAFASAQKGEMPSALHFAQINNTDGFFLVGRTPEPDFAISNLKGHRVLVDHGGQPLLMFNYACHKAGLQQEDFESIDAGSADEMVAAFKRGEGDYVHLQGPAPQQLEAEGCGVVVGRLGDWVGRCAFSSLASRSDWLESDAARRFMRAFRRARQWVNEVPAAEVAASEIAYFPDVSVEVLAETIGAYQALGCWLGQVEITPDQIAVSADVFRLGGVITGNIDPALVAVSPPG